MTDKAITIEPLTGAGFAPYGDVIESGGNDSFFINNGMAERFHALARVEASGEKAAQLSAWLKAASMICRASSTMRNTIRWAVRRSYLSTMRTSLLLLPALANRHDLKNFTPLSPMVNRVSIIIRGPGIMYC